MKKVIILFALISLAACDAKGNLGREESLMWHRRTPTADKVAYFKPRCEAYGFNDKSSEMSSCIQREIQGSMVSARARADSMQRDFNEMNANIAAQRSQRVRTTCTTIGITTQCY